MNNDTSTTSGVAACSSRTILSASSQSWELSKENIQPIRSGRNVAVIDQVMQMQQNRHDMLANEQQHFEDQIRTNTSDDPLDAWYRYYRWFEEHYPSGKEAEMLSLVQKCLKSFSADKRYSNDRRLLKIWLKYAEGRQSTLSVYEFMYQNGNCTRLADFYIRWADCLESAEDYRKTTEIFKIAKQMQAKPTEKLMEAQRMFEERMALREIQNEQEAHGQEEETRCFLGNLKGVGKKREAPVIRASTGFASGLGQKMQSRGEIQSTGNKVGFNVYEDSNRSEKLVQLKTKTVSVGALPMAESVKENYRAPTAWSNANLAGKRYSSATNILPAFEVYTDDNLLSDKQRRQTTANDSHALHTKKDEQQLHPVHSLIDQISSKNERYMFDKARLYAGTKEYSFEEMRALRFVPTATISKIGNCGAKLNNIAVSSAFVSEPIEAVSESSNIGMSTVAPTTAPTRRGLQIRTECVVPIVNNASQSNNIVQSTFADGAVATSNTANNTSMTRNIYKETLAVFSNTLQLQTDAVVDDLEKMEDDGNESIFAVKRVEPFEVYCDIPERKQSVMQSASMDNNDPDKENNRPPDYVCPPKREKSGILLSAKDFDIESDIPDESDEKMSKLDSTFVKPIVPESKKTVSKSMYSDETTTMFDANEPTLARYSTLSATNRAASTPCDGKVVRPCFSARRWDEVDQVLDELKPLTENVTRQDDIIIQIPNIIDIERSTNEPTNGDRRLSMIQESSREYRSGSSGLSTTNGFLKNTPRAATPNMPAIVENNSAEMERDKLDGAVRRLSLSGDEPTGVGMKIGIIGDTNPWDVQVQERILAQAKLAPNYHRFANCRMPIIKANSAVAIGGERLKIDALIGQGAFAKIYRCYADEGDLWVMKMQKPACAWEFYICEELRRRLSSEALVGVMSIRDAFIYDDGSLLMNEYYPLGTLLDIRNKYRLAGSDMHEFVVIYLLIQILKIVEAVHSVEIIHADIKPDNFLITGCIEVTSNWEELIGGLSSRTVKLIDWGRGIDMRQMRGRTFKGKVGTSGFECCEMQDGRPWTYQTDLYGLLGSVHVLLYGSYMNVFNERNRYRTTSVIKRRWKREVWIPLFDELLNITDCSSIPSLASIRYGFEQTFKSILQVDKHSWLVSARQFNDHLTK